MRCHPLAQVKEKKINKRRGWGEGDSLFGTVVSWLTPSPLRVRATNSPNMDPFVHSILSFVSQSSFWLALMQTDFPCCVIFDSDGDFHSGCRSVSQCHPKQSFSGLRSVTGWTYFTDLWRGNICICTQAGYNLGLWGGQSGKSSCVVPEKSMEGVLVWAPQPSGNSSLGSYFPLLNNFGL